MNDLEFGIWPGQLEIRRAGAGSFMRASFPLNVTATRSNVGRVRKERFASGSQSWQVREFEKLQVQMAQVVASSMDKMRKRKRVEELEDQLEKRNTHLLIGHDFNKAIADMKSGTLKVNHTPSVVEIEAVLPEEALQPSWVKDAVLAVQGGQLRGISPGFKVTNKGAERLVPEDGGGDSLVREILDAMVVEYSIVSRPAYPLTTVDARSDRWSYIPIKRRYWL